MSKFLKGEKAMNLVQDIEKLFDEVFSSIFKWNQIWK